MGVAEADLEGEIEGVAGEVERMSSEKILRVCWGEVEEGVEEVVVEEVGMVGKGDFGGEVKSDFVGEVKGDLEGEGNKEAVEGVEGGSGSVGRLGVGKGDLDGEVNKKGKVGEGGAWLAWGVVGGCEGLLISGISYPS